MRCLKSIPVSEDIQVIVVDDNSPDADTYLERYPELSRPYLEYIRTTKGGGAGYARNVGLKYAKGKWLLFADADDFFVNNMYDIISAHVESDADVIYFQKQAVYSDDINRKSTRSGYLDRIMDIYLKTGDELPVRTRYHVPWAKMIKRCMVEKYNIRFEEIMYSNDVLFSTYVGFYAKKIEAIDTVLYVVTDREGSLSYFSSKPDELRIRADAAFRRDCFLLQHNMCQKRESVYYLKRMLSQDRNLFKYYFTRLDEIYPSKLAALKDISKGCSLRFKVKLLLYSFILWIISHLRIVYLNMITYIKKLSFISGLAIDIRPNGIMLRGRNKTKRFILCCLSPFFFIVGFVLKTWAHLRALYLNSHSQYIYKLAIVAIVKDEGDYIEEWLSFHKVVGFDCIFLYDNDSSDGTKELIQPYIDSGFVVYNSMHGERQQYPAYNHAIKTYGHLCKYMAFIDVDEFLLPKNPSINMKEIVEQAFERDKNTGAIGINWYIYGSSGHQKKTPGLVIERFLYRASTDCVTNRHIKSIVKPSCVRLFDHPHFARLYRGYYTTGLHGELIGSWYHPIVEEDELRINHYIIKSKEENDIRSARKRADNGFYKPADQFERYDKNEVKDTTALNYLSIVKETMQRAF